MPTIVSVKKEKWRQSEKYKESDKKQGENMVSWSNFGSTPRSVAYDNLIYYRADALNVIPAQHKCQSTNNEMNIRISIYLFTSLL